MSQLTSWIGRRFFAWAIVAGLLAVCSSALLTPDTAFAQGSIRTDIEIDHSRTGFPLSGGHAQVVCERCHLQGIFRGTPTQCMQCHSPGGRVVSTFKSSNHLPTTVNCSSCHRTTNWTPAFFTHNGVAPGTCSKCHNQTTAVGKSATHIPTTMSCDSCHRTVGWTGAAFKHQGVGPGTCATCHNGIQAQGKSAGHLSTAASCDSCHRMGAANWMLVSNGYDHTGIVTGCATCHNGTTARGKTATHVPTTAACELCHKSTTTFTGAQFSHTGITTGCATCHNGSTALGKPANHIPVATACETCHKSTTAFSGSRYHSWVVATPGQCNTCHESGTNWLGVQGKRPSGHNGREAAPNSCDNSGCHNTSTFSK